jgi:hypothetical protein
MVTAGQFGGALAFLATFILMRGNRQPVLAGCSLALISVKPQFAASLGFFLLLVGHWRVVLAAVPATAGLVGLSVLAFGIEPWRGFFDWTLPFHAKLLSTFQVGAFRAAISVYTAARMMGTGHMAAQALQLAFGLPVMAGAAILMVRKGPDPRTIALALFAVLVALPYTAIHDVAIMAPALTVALFADASGARRPFLSLGPASAVWFAPAFAVPFGYFALPVVSVVTMTVMALALVVELWPVVARRSAAPPSSESGTTSRDAPASAAQ